MEKFWKREWKEIIRAANANETLYIELQNYSDKFVPCVFSSEVALEEMMTSAN